MMVTRKCKICGKSYQVCPTCETVKSFMPWRTLVCSLEEYQVFSILSDYLCNKDAVTAAINAIQQQICNLGSQNGMNFMQVINAINSGNAALANTLQSCCCDVKQLTYTEGKLTLPQQGGFLYLCQDNEGNIIPSETKTIII